MGKYERVKRIAKFAGEVAIETLWPTRCAVCDLAGIDVLCDECRAKLCFIDMYKACSKCGAPHGQIQCTECNDVMLASSEIKTLPFNHMSHALLLDDAAHRIVAIYKDSSERRLVKHIANMMAQYISPDMVSYNFVLTYIPDSDDALRRRGFDHGQEIAEHLGRISGLSVLDAFERPKSKDQRKLGRRERSSNMNSQMELKPGINLPKNILLIDDVCTTGATIYSACNALRNAGVDQIEVLTFGLVLS